MLLADLLRETEAYCLIDRTLFLEMDSLLAFVVSNQ
jgi:hypothetical protein